MVYFSCLKSLGLFCDFICERYYRSLIILSAHDCAFSSLSFLRGGRAKLCSVCERTVGVYGDIGMFFVMFLALFLIVHHILPPILPVAGP